MNRIVQDNNTRSACIYALSCAQKAYTLVLKLAVRTTTIWENIKSMEKHYDRMYVLTILSAVIIYQSHLCFHNILYTVSSMQHSTIYSVVAIWHGAV